MSRALTILCSSPGWGGLEMNTVKLAKALLERGWAVTALAVEESAFYKEAARQGIPVAGVQPPGALRTASRARRTAAWMKRTDSTLLLTPFNKDIAAAAFAKRFFFRRARLVYQQHMKVGLAKRDPLHTWRYAALDAWIAPLQYLRQEVLEKTRVPAGKIHVIPFGIDVEFFRTASFSKEEARAQLELPSGVPVIGVLGRIDPKKGQDFLIDALPALDEKTDVPYHLLIAGSSTLGEGEAYEKSLHARVQALGLGGRVHFRKAAEDVRPFYRAIDVFAMPSEGETYGMVTLEALASGLPVVGTDRDGTREILGESAHGYLFRPADVAGFTARLDELQKKSRTAAQAFPTKYSFDRMVSATEAVLSVL